MVKQCMAWAYKQFISIIIKAHRFKIREKKISESSGKYLQSTALARRKPQP
jgi:hypothetical protein